jgi:hypothetical protein
MNQNKDIKSFVLDKIQSGKISMRPRVYFVLKVVSLVVVSVLTLLTSSLLVSFIIFSLVNSGKLFLLGFGLHGFLMFFALFPWPLFVVEIILIVLLEWLIKRYQFGYRTSLSRLVFVILLVSVVISAIINITPFHSTLLHRAEQRNLPFVGDYYRGIRRPPSGQEIFRGVVSDVGTSTFVLNQRGDVGDGGIQKYIIDVPPNVPRSVFPAVGDTVFVAGKLLPDNDVQAYGFQKFLSPDSD